ncbi:hypothetical protein [Stenotrophomonas sp. CFBP 13718]|uniref:hypothetical protein n=1 Tax=Stenotrophomonas sp. CFBP 13718 TaxID=2775304 RepID=UPI00177AA955|nr:hypothetical protein [Stenotrophomonas sp. CFBP 13718]MBD8696594.1 hypothetical protein [Stenotrophomonas sp. CFBP 13718]
MKITNNHRGPLGLPDGTVLAPGVEETVANWEHLKKNTVVQGWIKAKILTINGDATPPPASPSLLGSNVLPVRIDLVDDVSVSLGDVVRRAHAASGLSIEDWNGLDGTLREAKLADAVEQLRSEAIAEAEAKTRADAAAAATGAASAGGAAGADGGSAPDPVTDKAVLVARAKELGVAGVGSHWGTGKLQEAIAEAEAKKKSEG